MRGVLGLVDRIGGGLALAYRSSWVKIAGRFRSPAGVACRSGMVSRQAAP